MRYTDFTNQYWQQLTLIAKTQKKWKLTKGIKEIVESLAYLFQTGAHLEINDYGVKQTRVCPTLHAPVKIDNEIRRSTRG